MGSWKVLDFWWLLFIECSLIFSARELCTTHPASLCTCHREHTLCGVVCRRRLRQCWVGWKTWASLPVKLPSWRAACVAGRGRALSGPDQIRCRSVIPARLGVTTTSTTVSHGYRSVCLFVCHKLSILKSSVSSARWGWQNVFYAAAAAAAAGGGSVVLVVSGSKT